MSLGPSLVHLAVRNPGSFDDTTSKLTELTNNAKEAAGPLPQVGEVSGGAAVPIQGGITGPFNAAAYNDNFYKRGNVTGDEETNGELLQMGSTFKSSGFSSLGALFGISPFQPDSFFEFFSKREETPTPKLLGLSIPTNILGGGDFFAGEFDPDEYYRRFPRRDNGHVSLSKTYQKLHTALNAVAVRELD
ncbi:hypothetical protein DL96DRAFT_1590082 [Flagelloscypha sp. PMI_526]|nr:hypothetical protein DL96DRAFT_1590082 [Flagelloscypha sp. PMI_526]